MSTELEVVSKDIAPTAQQRAIAVFSHIVEADLETLAAALKDVTTITNADGYQQVHAGRMRLKNERIAIEKAGKAGREEATKISKAIIAEENRLVAITSAEEKRLQKIQDAWDAKLEAERQAKIDAELKRVADLKERVSELRGNQLLSPSDGSALIAEHISDLEKVVVDDSFEEFQQQAADAKAAGLARLRAIHTAAIAHEAEQERIKAERAELARLRALQAQRDAEATQQLSQKQEEQEAANRAERKRIADEEERLRESREAEEARLAAERADLSKQREALERKPVLKRGKPVQSPSAEEIINVLSAHYRARPDTILDWIRSIDWNKSEAA